MEMTEFNLSEKLTKSKDNFNGIFWFEDVKEFIKRLKEEIKKEGIMIADKDAQNIIDKLAGSAFK